MTDDKKYQVMPDLTDEEYAELKADIAERGVMVPIEFDEDGNCLDGHHRLKACKELGLDDYPSVTRAGMSEQEKLEHALELNIARRHLSGAQKRIAAREVLLKCPEMSDRRIARELGISHHTVTDVRKELENGGQIAHQETIVDARGTEQPREHKPVSVFNPSPRDAEALKDPDIQRRLAENDKMNVAGAIREQTRDNLIEHLESVETKEAKAVEGVYDVIVIDPPWPMSRIETDANPHAVEMDYPTMTLDEIKGLKIPAADDCHVFLWATQKYLPNAFDVFKAWGVKYVCCFVWHKNHGHKPFGLPKYNCEFVLYGHIGSPAFVHEDQFWACFEAPIAEHSEKPEKFYDMIRHVTAGRRLDMFNRRHIDGFETWGKEAKND